MVVTAPATSDDTNYSGMDADDVSVTNTDDETAGFTVTPTSGLRTTEAGGTDDVHDRAQRGADRGRLGRAHEQRRHRGHGVARDG